MEIKKYDEQFYIGQNDAKFFSQSARKAQPEILAAPEIKEVKAVKAVAEVKDEKTGKVITAAVAAVKAVKARPAIKHTPASDSCVFPRVAAKSERILQEIIARLVMEGGKVREGDEIKSEKDKGFCISFEFPTLPQFRFAFKQSKGDGKHNKKASDLFKADLKVKNKIEADKKKEKEDAKKKEAESKATKGTKEKKSEGEDWGEQ